MSIFRPNLNRLLPITTALGLCTGAVQAQVLEAGSDATIRDSLCVGGYCADDPSPGFTSSFASLMLRDTITRIDFEDTSSPATSFASNDWSIEINDSARNGQEYFAIEDRTAGVIPFRIDAGAPANALYVDDAGQVGLGTALPTDNLHIEDPFQPGIRLRQNPSGGFGERDWRLIIGGFGLNLIDVVHNSTPFILFDNAPNNALVIGPDQITMNDNSLDTNIRMASETDVDAFFLDAGTNRLGLGTAHPGAALHLSRGDGSASVLVENTGGDPGVPRELFKLSSNGGSYFTFENTSAGTTWFFNHENAAPNRFIITDAVADGPELTLTAEGVLTVQGGFVAGATTLDVPDYVFEDDYALRPLSEVASFVEQNRHLPDVPSAAEIADSGLDMTAMQMALLKKVEELTLYTLEQERTARMQANRIAAQEIELARMDALEADNADLAIRLAAQGAQLARIEAALAKR